MLDFLKEVDKASLTPQDLTSKLRPKFDRMLKNNINTEKHACMQPG